MQLYRAMRGLVPVSLVAGVALACFASRIISRQPDEDEAGRRIRYSGGLLGRRAAPGELALTHLPVGRVMPFSPKRRPDRAGEDVQVNDPRLDHFYDFSASASGQLPFFCAIQSEASLAVSGPRVVVTYNSTAGVTYALDATGKVVTTAALIVGFSASADGGRTFRSGFLPPLPGQIETYFDNAVDVDRDGRFYAGYLAVSGPSSWGVAVSRSDDGGLTWSTPVLAASEGGIDKCWLAVGPDPAYPGQDVVYVTWTKTSSRTSPELRIARSVDGGATFSSPRGVLSSGTWSTPYVDRLTGRLYVAYGIPYSHVGLVASDDGGTTFTPLSPGVANAPNPALVPAVSPGHAGDCGWGTLGVLHAGLDVRPQGSSTPRWTRSWWIGSQPFVAAHGDLVAFAWSASSSSEYEDPASRSRVFVIVSRDRGLTFSQPRLVHDESAADPQHVEPSVAIDPDTRDVHVSYVVQHADETLDTELATFRESDGYASFRTTRLSSVSSTIPPTNVSLPSGTTESYDVVGACYSLGHYMHLRAADGLAYAAWNDARNTVTHPVNPKDPLSGQTHSQPDVFFRAVRP
jgi:hypothetical protein